jgi:hypothetical protein
MSGLPNIQQNNEQVLNDIQSLQTMEQQLFNNLETNPNLSPQQQEQIVEKMNQISSMRVNLYKTLSGVNGFFENALNSSIGTLKEQTAAISIVESELNQAKRRLEMLEAEKNNKIRLVEINDYYGDKYAEHARLMKIIIFTLVPIIILAILNNKNILPNNIYYILIGIISIIGAIFFWRRMASIIMRDRMNYQEYDWYFNPNDAPTTTSTTISSDPWFTNKFPGTCIGQACCSDGQVWDASINQCIGTSTVSGFTTMTTEPFTTESMVNQVLTKGSNKYKTDINLKQVKPAPSESFINY